MEILSFIVICAFTGLLGWMIGIAIRSLERCATSAERIAGALETDFAAPEQTGEGP